MSDRVSTGVTKANVAVEKQAEMIGTAVQNEEQQLESFTFLVPFSAVDAKGSGSGQQSDKTGHQTVNAKAGQVIHFSSMADAAKAEKTADVEAEVSTKGYGSVKPAAVVETKAGLIASDFQVSAKQQQTSKKTGGRTSPSLRNNNTPVGTNLGNAPKVLSISNSFAALVNESAIDDVGKRVQQIEFEAASKSCHSKTPDNAKKQQRLNISDLPDKVVKDSVIVGDIKAGATFDALVVERDHDVKEAGNKVQQGEDEATLINGKTNSLESAECVGQSSNDQGKAKDQHVTCNQLTCSNMLDGTVVVDARKRVQQLQCEASSKTSHFNTPSSAKQKQNSKATCASLIISKAGSFNQQIVPDSNNNRGDRSNDNLAKVLGVRQNAINSSLAEVSKDLALFLADEQKAGAVPNAASPALHISNSDLAKMVKDAQTTMQKNTTQNQGTIGYVEYLRQ
ncbi:hypothetical protein A4A49_23141 [Nicotiana attenuata]|uniref:Uncharacterized protein n=1 Tax=Nicotiana attenuata TaxID=49451 RepID=A0A1J6I2Q9_NICAT|nr:hypothetical protein A4A49_23141 [Nicotiana attenuata]